jgi:hypothetical protein
MSLSRIKMFNRSLHRRHNGAYFARFRVGVKPKEFDSPTRFGADLRSAASSGATSVVTAPKLAVFDSLPRSFLFVFPSEWILSEFSRSHFDRLRSLHRILVASQAPYQSRKTRMPG